ncbi:MAG TPA: FAD-dependent oxidoreductase [Acidimicrobiales bacterium]|nr:FAD-dependent oxidoreductase [Acidimicrobiales bacterium]
MTAATSSASTATGSLSTDGPLSTDGSVTVVGASLAGLRTVQGLREHGFTGRITLVGDEMHYPYDRPPLSKQVLAGTWPPERTVLADYHALHDLGVEVRLGHRAVALDADAGRVALDDGATVDADRVVVATGARPRMLPGTDGIDGVLALRTLDDCEALRHRVTAVGPGCRVVVVGAGFIGSEVASTCADLGCRVTVLEALPTPLAPALGEQIGAAVATLHGRHGVDLRTGTGVAGIGPDRTVTLSDGTSVPADVVVVGIGVVPNVEWLDGSGLAVDNGVVCDAGLFAADRVVAAGDLARWDWANHGDRQTVRIEHWEVAAQMGGAAARSLLAGRDAAAEFDPVPYFWSDQYGLRIQVLGRPLPTDEVAVVHGALPTAAADAGSAGAAGGADGPAGDGDPADDGKFVALYGRNGRLAAALAVSRPRQLMAFRPLLLAGAGWDEALALLDQS